MKRFETFLNENYRAVKHVTKRPDMQDHAKTFRVMVKGIKANPGQEIIFTKKIEDPEYTKKTGLGDSTGIEVQPISGKPLGKPWTEKRGNREYTYEVIAISEETTVNEELSKTVSIEPQDADELMKTYTPAVTAVLRKYGLTPGSGAKETVRIYTVELEFPDYRLTWSKTNKGGVTLALRVTKKEKSGLGGKYTGSLKNIVKEIDRVGKQLS
jgi:hypothetical protein